MSEEQQVQRRTDIGILKQSEAGAKTSELCLQHGISAATFYSWRSKYGGLEVSEAKRLKQLEENRGGYGESNSLTDKPYVILEWPPKTFKTVSE